MGQAGPALARQVRTLRLASNALRCDGVEALRPLLRGAAALRELDLSDNALGTAGVLALVRSPPCVRRNVHACARRGARMQAQLHQRCVRLRSGRPPSASPAAPRPFLPLPVCAV